MKRGQAHKEPAVSQFRWEVSMTWTKVVMMKMERHDQGRISNWLDVVVNNQTL